LCPHISVPISACAVIDDAATIAVTAMIYEEMRKHRL
jgi:hypothetical protein